MTSIKWRSVGGGVVGGLGLLLPTVLLLGYTVEPVHVLSTTFFFYRVYCLSTVGELAVPP